MIHSNYGGRQRQENCWQRTKPRNTWIPREKQYSLDHHSLKFSLMPEPRPSLFTRKKRGWGGQIQSIPYQSAVLRKSDSMEEKVNPVSMVTKVWKKYLEINVIVTCTFTYRPAVIKNSSTARVMSPCNHQETIWTRPADLLLLGLEQQCHHLEKHSHIRQHHFGIWTGRSNLQDNFQMI